MAGPWCAEPGRRRRNEEALGRYSSGFELLTEALIGDPLVSRVLIEQDEIAVVLEDQEGPPGLTYVVQCTEGARITGCLLIRCRGRQGNRPANPGR